VAGLWIARTDEADVETQWVNLDVAETASQIVQADVRRE
jgi:hypothetical protein